MRLGRIFSRAWPRQAVRFLLLGGAVAVASCDAPKLQTFLQDAGTSFQVTQTFGELVAIAPTVQVAHYLEVQLTPAATPVFVPTTGEIVFDDNFDGLTNCIIIKPKLRDKDKATPLEKLGAGLPEPEHLRIALCNLDNSGSPSPLNAAILALYKQSVGDADAPAKTTRFFDMTLEEKKRRGDVWAAPEAVFPDPAAGGKLKPWSRLGPAAGGKLQIAAFQRNDNGDLIYLNPTPYLAKIPLSPPAAALQPPTIAEIRIETATDADFTAGLKSYTVDIGTGVMTPADKLEGFARVFLRLNNPGPAPLVAPHEISYELRQAGSATLRSHARVFFNSLATSSAVALATISETTGELLYRTAGAAGTISDPTTDTLWLQLLFDPSPLKPGAPPNYDIGSLTPANFLEIAATAAGQPRYPGGDYELEIVLASGFGAAASDTKVVKFTLAGVNLEFVRDAPPVNVVDASDPAIVFADIGHWGADNGTGLDGYDAGNSVRNGLAPADNFIDGDPDRFYLRILDAGANTNAGTPQQITASISTLLQNNSVDDNATNIRLDETGPDTGLFVSKALLLTGPDVPFEAFTDSNGNCSHNGAEAFTDSNGNGSYDTDNPDDDFPVHDGFTGTVCDDAPNDRTHRATVDGSMKTVYTTSAGAVLNSTIPVCERAPEARRVLNMVVHIFREPWEDVGFGPDPDGAGPLNPPGAGNASFDWNDTTGPNVGSHDAGEASEPFIDISSGAVVFARGEAGGGTRRGVIWEDSTPFDGTLQSVDRAMDHARSLLSSACIRIVETSRVFDDPAPPSPAAPAQLLFRHPGTLGQFQDFAPGNTPTPDETLLQNGFRSAVNLDANRDNDVMDMYFLAPLSTSTASQYRPGKVDSVAGMNSQFINQVHIGLSMLTSRFLDTVGHEIGHQLSNQPHSAAPDHVFFPNGNAVADSGRTWNLFRRMQHAMQTIMRTDHGNDYTTAVMQANGNHLLRNP